MDAKRKSRVISGLALIGVGAGLFWLREEVVGQSVLFLAIGGVFLAAYLYGKSLGFLVPCQSRRRRAVSYDSRLNSSGRFLST